MRNYSKIETLVYLGFTEAPFRNFELETADGLRIHRALAVAVNGRELILIVGDPGSGKTRSVIAALNQLGVRLVVVRALDRERLLIGHVEEALILDLSDERPRRSREIRTRQLRRLLGEASRRSQVVLVIEEAHRLHGQTLRALKSLRELDWAGEVGLLTVVLLCQSDPMSKPGMAEVRLRSDSVYMHGLGRDEVVQYVKATVGSVFTDEAIVAVSRLPDARNFLGLQEILFDAMNKAVMAGRQEVWSEDVTEEGTRSARTSRAGMRGEVGAERGQSKAKEDVKLEAILRRRGSAERIKQAVEGV